MAIEIGLADEGAAIKELQKECERRQKAARFAPGDPVRFKDTTLVHQGAAIGGVGVVLFDQPHDVDSSTQVLCAFAGGQIGVVATPTTNLDPYKGK